MAVLRTQIQRPDEPSFIGITGPGGQLREDFRLGTPERLKQIQQGGPGYQAFQKEALAAPGESPWEKMMMERQAAEEGMGRDLAQSQGAAMGQNIWNQMAMRGGAGAGSRERAAMAGKRAGLSGMQNVARQGTMDRANIGVQGEERRMGLLSQLPGMEFQRTQFGTGLSQQDIANAMADMQRRQQFEDTKYSRGMQEYAAEQMAKALEPEKKNIFQKIGGFLSPGLANLF